MIAFSGVRISWLMVARKVDFALLAWSAASRASRSVCSTCLRAVMSSSVHSSTSTPRYFTRTMLVVRCVSPASRNSIDSS